MTLPLPVMAAEKPTWWTKCKVLLKNNGEDGHHSRGHQRRLEVGYDAELLGTPCKIYAARDSRMDCTWERGVQSADGSPQPYKVIDSPVSLVTSAQPEVVVRWSEMPSMVGRGCTSSVTIPAAQGGQYSAVAAWIVVGMLGPRACTTYTTYTTY